MKLSDTDLKQLDKDWALGLSPLRKDKLLVTLIEDLKESHERLASHYAVCQDVLEAQSFRPHGGHYVLDVTTLAHQGLAGLSVSHEKHLYGQTPCAGRSHLNHSSPGSCPDDASWKKLPMNERGLVGPMLASLIVCMAQRMRLSRHYSQEFLHDWLGVDLSISTINRCIPEVGRAVEPLEEELVKEIEAAVLAHADETPWPARSGAWKRPSTQRRSPLEEM